MAFLSGQPSSTVEGVQVLFPACVGQGLVLTWRHSRGHTTNSTTHEADTVSLPTAACVHWSVRRSRGALCLVACSHLAGRRRKQNEYLELRSAAELRLPVRSPKQITFGSSENSVINTLVRCCASQNIHQRYACFGGIRIWKARTEKRRSFRAWRSQKAACCSTPGLFAGQTETSTLHALTAGYGDITIDDSKGGAATVVKGSK